MYKRSSEYLLAVEVASNRLGGSGTTDVDEDGVVGYDWYGRKRCMVLEQHVSERTGASQQTRRPNIHSLQNVLQAQVINKAYTLQLSVFRIISRPNFRFTIQLRFLEYMYRW